MRVPHPCFHAQNAQHKASKKTLYLAPNKHPLVSLCIFVVKIQKSYPCVYYYLLPFQ